ncbi:MarR family transcriptional regulator [Lysinibacter cavernae]|uniref:DNA-binding MarR family transcriptional regulator n=1 Tax=Lysinibacter cavernae TaxID=1640652 RepID=A0A7X5R3U6_9MICO|nr:DNA-binding MarR family transcriptional regulator [Lysinibacter cavernae]
MTVEPEESKPARASARRNSLVELCHDFRIANARLNRRLRQEKADNRLTDGQLSALGALSTHGPQTLSQLSEHERVTLPSASRTVNSLEQAGLVGRSGSADDGRKVMLSVTDAGEAVMSEVRRQRDEWLVKRVSKLTPAQRQTLAEATELMKEITQS